MTIRKELGKIQSATFGLGGYQDVQIGFWLTLGGEGWGVSANAFWLLPTPAKQSV